MQGIIFDMTRAARPHPANCPLEAVDRRLDDVHRQWHEAEAAYFDPDGFRVAIQSAIQTLRTVTFILQSNKRIIPDFDNWYSAWQEKLRDDPLMRWMVDARNKIEKRGDLEAHSYIRAKVLASFLNKGPVMEVRADLFDGISQIFARVPKGALAEHILKNGVLSIERRWIENSLPDQELLDAVAVAFGRISELVSDDHLQLGLQAPVTIHQETGEVYPMGREGRLPCMVGHEDRRAVKISLSDGKVLNLATEMIRARPEDREELESRYGPVRKIFETAGSIEEILLGLFENAKNVTKIDGHHIGIIFLLRSLKVAGVHAFVAEDQA